MSSKGGLTLPDIRNNTVQSPIAGDFARDIPHNIEVPDIKLRLKVLRRDGTSFSEVVK
jgi:hypothetical protein